MVVIYSVVAWQHSTIMATTCVYYCTCNESRLLHHWHAHTCTYVCTVPTTLLTLRWCRSSCCSNIQQFLALETHSAMHGECKQTKTVETTQHRYTCAFSYVHKYIQLFLRDTYGSSHFLQPSVSLHTCTVHTYSTCM